MNPSNVPDRGRLARGTAWLRMPAQYYFALVGLCCGALPGCGSGSDQSTDRAPDAPASQTSTGKGTSGLAQDEWPSAVQNEIAEMIADCRAVGGTPPAPQEFLFTADLTGDGLPDHVISWGDFYCDGAASLFSGSGGSNVAVYVAGPERQASLGFESTAFEVKIEKASGGAELWLMVQGRLCGQDVTRDMSHAEEEFCWRAVAWDPKARKMEFADLSEIRPVLESD